MVGDTYILKTLDNELYCGYSENLEKRLIEHKKEKYPHWFSFKDRKSFILIWYIKGNYEKDIKRFGIKKFVECLRP
jgi:predicted GIY-YIG superfamily endonuclease